MSSVSSIIRIGILAFFLSAVSPAWACLHFGKAFVGKVDEGTQQALLFHDGTLAHLVIKTDVHAKDGKLPPQLSWVLPFPAMPKQYEEVSNDVFKELTGLVSVQRQASWGMRGAKTGAVKGIVVHEPKEVGQYKIQEIEIVDESGGKELNAWLAAHHYNEMPLDLQKPYLKKGAVFLAITVTLDSKDASFKPLHVAYPASDLRLPIKFTHDNRVFDVNVFVFTAKPLGEAEAIKPYLTFNAKEKYDAAVRGSHPALKKLLGERDGFLARLEGHALNSDGKRLRDLPEDPRFLP